MRISDWSSDVCSSDLRLVAGVFAEEVVLVRGCQRGVAVGRSDHPEGVRVDPQLFLDRKPALERLADIASSSHLWRRPLGERKIAKLPARDRKSTRLNSSH